MKKALIFLSAAALLTAGCGSSGSSQGTGATGATNGNASVAAPADIASAGKLVFCSDISYPPEEFYKGTTPVGSDIEIGDELASLMGVKAEFENVGFDGIIAALLSNKCDAIISGMNDTPERAKQVSFAHYLSVGMSIMVPKGNPASIHGPLDLCGHTAGGQIGTTAYIYLQRQTTRCQDAGKPKINIVGYKEDTDGANATIQHKVDAYLTDSPVIAYYIKLNPTSLEFGSNSSIEPGPVGIAVRKEDTQLVSALNKGIAAMYADGSMMKILDRWNLGDFALKK
jgi:polar amino acid transport system substrate-binding protein